MLAELLLPTFSSLFGRHLALDMTSNLLLIPVLLGLLAILAFGAGSVPALVLARLRPIAVLQKQSEIYRGGIVSRSLVVVQLALSLVLLISATGVLLQLRYVDTKPLGYTKDHVIMLTHHATTETAQQMSGDDIAARMRTELADDPRVLHIAPVPGWASKGFESMMLIPLKGEDVEVDVYVVDEEFIPALDIRLLAGRNFATDRPSDLNNSVIVNEAFTRTIGLANPVGTQLPISSSGDGDALVNPTVIGVVQDFHSRPLVWSIHPAILRMGSRPPKGFSLIKIAGDDYQSTLASIETAWNRVTGGSRFQYSVLAEDLAISYYAEENFLKLISYSAAASLMVALLGLFALAGLRAVSRLKEVSIRKVMGASVPSLLRTLNTEFALIVCVANLIAWPVAYYILNRWLAAFVYRIELTVWPFLLIGLATSATALAVVSYHTIKAASTNPAQVLRHE
jgi:putative ABC transport system permease protein